MIARLSGIVLSSALLGACTCSGAGPTAGGDTPYVRCAMREPAAMEATVGALHLHGEGRTLTVEGASAPLRIAAFRGAALADEPLEPALDAIEAGTPALAVALGSLGDDEARVEGSLRALATLSVPVLIVLGGRDHPADLDAALRALPDDARSHLVDASGLREIRVAGLGLVPVAGAPGGRYARDDEACGLGPDDADAIVADLGSGDALRFVLGWSAPAPVPGLEGGEAGSDVVASVLERTGARGGVYGWPDAPLAAPGVLAPPLAGPPALLTDGSRLGPGVVLVELSDAGLRVVPPVP